MLEIKKIKAFDLEKTYHLTLLLPNLTFVKPCECSNEIFIEIPIPRPSTAHGVGVTLLVVDRPLVANIWRQKQVRTLIVNGLRARMTAKDIIQAHKTSLIFSFYSDPYELHLQQEKY
jgi:hypothetical protein